MAEEKKTESVNNAEVKKIESVDNSKKGKEVTIITDNVVFEMAAEGATQCKILFSKGNTNSAKANGKSETAEKKTEAKYKNKDIRPAWLPWLIIGAELAFVLCVGIIVCVAALAA